MFFFNLVRNFAAFEQQLLAKRKYGSFRSYSGSGNSAIFLLIDWFSRHQSLVASLRIVTPGAEFCGVTLSNAL